LFTATARLNIQIELRRDPDPYATVVVAAKGRVFRPRITQGCAESKASIATVFVASVEYDPLNGYNDSVEVRSYYVSSTGRVLLGIWFRDYTKLMLWDGDKRLGMYYIY
jgi:hypothetical protein